MNVIAIAGIAVIAAILSAMLKRYHKEYGIIITIAAGILILLCLLSEISPALNQISTLLSEAGIGEEYAQILFKALGICFLAQFSADSCRDAGESALAFKVELAGRLAVVLLALPLFESIAESALSLIGGGI